MRKARRGRKEQVEQLAQALILNGDAQRFDRRKKVWSAHDLKVIRPITKTQEQAFINFETKYHNVLNGSAGTGKTFLAMYHALKAVIVDKEQASIAICRSAVACRDQGFLPGPQPLDAKILTPNGWVRMGDINVGDKVISRSGSAVNVLGVFPKGVKDVYKITTTDGTSTEACLDHLWLTRTFEDHKRNRVGSVKSTDDILKSIRKNGKINHYLPRNMAVMFSEKELPILPYTLGAILGNGCIGDSINIATIDSEVANRISNEIATLGCRLVANGILYNIRSDLFNNKPARGVILKNTITGETTEFESVLSASKGLSVSKGFIRDKIETGKEVDDIKYYFSEGVEKWTNPIKNELFKLGLSNKKAIDKFIPDIYKTASIEQRLDLLRGLMDTDGTIKKNGESSYCTISKTLALDIIDIVRSLGGRATLCSRNRVGKASNIGDRCVTTRNVSYEFTISLPESLNPFFVKRKANRYSQKYIRRVGVSNIEYVGEKEVQCILIDDDEHLYLTDDYIVTHNTLEEKSAPFEAPYEQICAELLGKRSSYSDLKNAGLIEFVTTGFLRGITIDDAIIISDETQNYDFSEINTLMTRVGQNTRIFFSADCKQGDLRKGQSGYHDALGIWEGMSDFGVVTFGHDDIVRSGTVKEWIIQCEKLEDYHTRQRKLRDASKNVSYLAESA